MDEKTQLIKEIEELKERRFMIDMIDRWTKEDTELYQKINQEINAKNTRVMEIENGTRKTI